MIGDGYLKKPIVAIWLVSRLGLFCCFSKFFVASKVLCPGASD